MCSEPIADEILWGDPDAAVEADRQIEELLAEDAECAGDDNFDEAHCCPECGEPAHLCQCGRPSFSAGIL